MHRIYTRFFPLLAASVALTALPASGEDPAPSRYVFADLTYFPEDVRPAAEKLAAGEAGPALEAVERERKKLEKRGLFARREPDKILLLEGLCREALGETDAAKAALRRSLSYRGGNSDALYYLGRSLRASGDVPGSIAAYQEALWFNRFRIASRGDTGLELGTTLLATNLPTAQQDAKAALETALADSPDNASARVLLAQLAVQGGDRQRALTMLQKEAVAASDDPKAKILLAEALLLNANRELDRASITQARDLTRTALQKELPPELHARAVEAYFRSLLEGGEIAEAEKVLARMKKSAAPSPNMAKLEEQLEVEKNAAAGPAAAKES